MRLDRFAYELGVTRNALVCEVLKSYVKIYRAFSWRPNEIYDRVKSLVEALASLSQRTSEAVACVEEKERIEEELKRLREVVNKVMQGGEALVLAGEKSNST